MQLIPHKLQAHDDRLCLGVSRHSEHVELCGTDHTATSLQHYCLSVNWYGLCRQGKIDDTVELLTTSAPSMPDYIRTAVIDLVKSQPEFYPMPSWTHLSQLHGPKVAAVRTPFLIFVYHHVA